MSTTINKKEPNKKSKTKLYRLNTKLNKLKEKKHLTEKEKIKLAETYAEKCAEEIFLGLFPCNNKTHK